jgi:hypothetical protein
MDRETFEASLEEEEPPDSLSAPLRALWYDGRGNWDRAHEIAQHEGGSTGAWIHAYLHRKEGDLSNASYWYRRANHSTPETSREEEWGAIGAALQKR